MRPVRLEMHGFAAFREPTVVDFTGAEYFALVGPTGSGKSTVIDALTFALYGTVPRWGDRRAVALGLAPHVSRGVVRLVFDVGDARFVAARELRRAARGVSVRNARLERLVDPADPDGAADVVAADSGVTPAVEELLGLAFEHFTSCVVLPQGEFAEFLHAKPGDRQAILTRLLGLGVYERIAREANQEATAAGHRAALLAEQLAAYADATDEAVADAAARVEALEALEARVATLLPELTAAEKAVDEADGAVAALRAEQGLLDGLAPPPGLAVLDGRRRAADEQLGAARSRFGDAEVADDAARKLVADAPARAPLERARSDHAHLADAQGARPVAVAALADAAAAERRAVAAVGIAEEAAEVATGARDATAAAHRSAGATVEELSRECALLAGVRPPTGLDASVRRHAAAVTARDEAAARLAAADTADAAAHARLAAAPARASLEQARRDHRALAAVEVAVVEAASRHREADEARASAAAAVAGARAALAAAVAQRDEAVRGDLAAAVRPSLAVGERCPVCEQPVAVLPAPLPGTDPQAHDAAVARAQTGLENALAAEADAVAVERHAAAERNRAEREVARLQAALADAAAELDLAGLDGVDARLDTADGIDAVLAVLDAVTAAAASADAAARRARRDREGAAAAVEAARAELASAARALRAARDPLVPLGAPEAADDPATGWAALGAWAAAQRAERDSALPGAHRAAAAAAAAAAEAERVAAAAAARLSTARRDATVAARTEQQARSRVEALDERIAALRAALAGAPPVDRVDDDLARLDAVEAAARAADAELRAARSARAAAEQAAEVVRREVAAGHDALRAVRDPLVPLGAPPVDLDDLIAAWTALVAWARRESAVRAERLPAALASAEAVRARRDAVGRSLSAALAAEGVAAEVRDGPGQRSAGVGASGGDTPGGAGGGAGGRTGVPSGPTAQAAVAAALAGARAVRGRLVERRAEAVDKRAERAEAEEAQQVAKMLGGLLRSDRFPRWLVASALDALVADASTALAELSGGQFELTHTDGEFLVVDHADADACRPVKTLSGGETFQASLALALALSAQMSALAAKGAARLDSIFLDEGFGTLDEANLDVVAGTLENLASRGDRMVGVITHVPALAERVPVRFAVRRDQRSSRVVREDAH